MNVAKHVRMMNDYSALLSHTKLKVNVEIAENNLNQIPNANQKLKMANKTHFKRH